MMKAYLFLFNDLMGSQKSVQAFLDTKKEILNWYSILPHSLILVSKHDAKELSTIIHTVFPNQFFLVSEISGLTSNGWLQEKDWDFINNPKSSGRWDAPKGTDPKPLI